MAVDDMQVNYIMHRDIKPGNILIKPLQLTPFYQVFLCDFGMAKILSPLNLEKRNNFYVQSLWYRAPEVLLGKEDGYSRAIDMWSVGALFLEIYYKKPYFSAQEEENQIVKILENWVLPS